MSKLDAMLEVVLIALVGLAAVVSLRRILTHASGGTCYLADPSSGDGTVAIEVGASSVRSHRNGASDSLPVLHSAVLNHSSETAT